MDVQYLWASAYIGHRSKKHFPHPPVNIYLNTSTAVFPQETDLLIAHVGIVLLVVFV